QEANWHRSDFIQHDAAGIFLLQYLLGLGAQPHGYTKPRDDAGDEDPQIRWDEQKREPQDANQRTERSRRDRNSADAKPLRNPQFEIHSRWVGRGVPTASCPIGNWEAVR